MDILSFDSYLRISDVYHLTESNFVFYGKPSNISEVMAYLEAAKSNIPNQTVNTREQFIVILSQSIISIRIRKGQTRLVGICMKVYREAIK